MIYVCVYNSHIIYIYICAFKTTAHLYAAVDGFLSNSANKASTAIASARWLGLSDGSTMRLVWPAQVGKGMRASVRAKK